MYISNVRRNIEMFYSLKWSMHVTHISKILYSRRTVSWVDVVSADVMHVYILVITSNQVNY